MPIMTEAIDKADWERQDKGLPPLPKKKISRPEPKMPEVPNQLIFSDIPLDKFDKLISATRRAIKNEEGAKFIGMDVVIELKRGPGRPAKTEQEKAEPESRIIKGWMTEGHWLELYRHIREKIDIRMIQY